MEGNGTFCISIPDSRIERFKGSFKIACIVHCYVHEVIFFSKTFHFKLTNPFGNSINHPGVTTVNSGLKQICAKNYDNKDNAVFLSFIHL